MGAVGATLLAMAGLKRLGLAHRARGPLDLEAFLPALGQGAIALTARTADDRGARCARGRSPIPRRDGRSPPNAPSSLSSRAPAAPPIAGHARIENGRVLFRGEVLRTDGSETFPSPPTDHLPTLSPWAERRDGSSPLVCPRACWCAARNHAITSEVSVMASQSWASRNNVIDCPVGSSKTLFIGYAHRETRDCSL